MNVIRYLRTVPGQVIRIDRRRLALRIARHLRPGLPAGVVKQEAIVNRWRASIQRPGAGVGKGLESEPMREFVKQDANQIDIGAVIVIQAKIKRRAIETSGVAQVHIELRIYFLRASIQIVSRQRVRQSSAVPGAGKWRVGKIAKDTVCSGRTQNRGIR